MLKRIDKILCLPVWKQLIILVLLLVLSGFIFYMCSSLFFDVKYESVMINSLREGGDVEKGYSEFPKETILQEGRDSSALVSGEIPVSSNRISQKEKIWYIISRMIDPGTLEDSQDKTFAFLIVLVGYVLFTGFFIALITNAYFSRIEKVENGLVRYKFRNHCLILGNNEMTIGIIEQIERWKEFPADSSYLILSEGNSKEIRAYLSSHLPAELEKRLYIFRGSRTSREELDSLSVEKAKMVMILGESSEQGVDSRNLECLKHISGIMADSSERVKNKLKCYLNIENQSAFVILQRFNFHSDIRKWIELQAFNLYESWANRILTGGSGWGGEEYPSLDYGNLTSAGRNTIRFIIAGFDLMGQALAIQASRIAHYGANIGTIISVIDEDAENAEAEFKNNYPGLDEMIDINFEFYRGNIESIAIRELIAGWTKDENCLISLAICYMDSDRSLGAGINLPWDIYESNIPVLIRQETLEGFASVIKNEKIADKDDIYRNIRFFGMRSEACDLEFDRDRKAKILHEQYIALSRFDGSYNPEKQNYFDWEDLPEQYRWSNRYQVDIYPVKIRTLERFSRVYSSYRNSGKDYGKILNAVYRHKFKNDKKLLEELKPSEELIENLLYDIELLAEIEHNRWISERILLGWKRGEIRDDNRRLSPYMVAYNQLEEEIKNYDREPSVRMFELT